jgi:hypothetical protein
MSPPPFLWTTRVNHRFAVHLSRGSLTRGVCSAEAREVSSVAAGGGEGRGRPPIDTCALHVVCAWPAMGGDRGDPTMNNTLGRNSGGESHCLFLPVIDPRETIASIIYLVSQKIWNEHNAMVLGCSKRLLTSLWTSSKNKALGHCRCEMFESVGFCFAHVSGVLFCLCLCTVTFLFLLLILHFS